MPFTPDRIRRKLEGRRADIQADEGLLYKIQLNNTDYFAKQWHGKHGMYVHDHEVETVMFSEDSERSAVSPYWAKLKYYEAALVHRALPDQTVKIHLAHDPRIVQQPNGDPLFRPRRSHPLTVTCEVKGDEALIEKRNQLVLSAYEKRKQYMRTSPGGNLSVAADQMKKFDQVMIQTDQEMVNAFGEMLSLPLLNLNNPVRSLSQIETYIKEQCPDSPVLQFIQYGLFPTHPQYNFIPTKQSPESKKIEGVFIEVAIIDIEKYYKNLSSHYTSEQSKQHLRRTIERYLLYRKLDELYDRVLGTQNVSPRHEQFQNNSYLQSNCFQLLEAIRKKCEQYGLGTCQDLLRHQKNLLTMTFQFSRSVSEIAQHLQQNKHVVQEWSPEATE